MQIALISHEIETQGAGTEEGGITEIFLHEEIHEAAAAMVMGPDTFTALVVIRNFKSQHLRGVLFVSFSVFSVREKRFQGRRAIRETFNSI